MEITPEPKNALRVVSCVSYYARGEPDLTSEPHGGASEIKSGGNDLTEVLLMTRQKLVFSVGAVAFMWFHKQSRDESGLESS